VAVANRQADKAAAFAAEFKFVRHLGSYDDVLCEKPLALGRAGPRRKPCSMPRGGMA
jgi:hypothetical protein